MSSIDVNVIVHNDLVEDLLKLGADLNAKNNDGDSPTHAAMQYGDYEVVLKLLEYGGNINIKNHSLKSSIAIALEEIKFLFSNLIVNQN